MISWTDVRWPVEIIDVRDAGEISAHDRSTHRHQVCEIAVVIGANL